MPIAGVLHAQENHDLASLSVDDLMNVEVTSVSRKAQKLSDTPAAVFVITQDDIRRSGATSIPEVLRIVPGLEVARLTGNAWAVSARGSNGQYANKLLVMIDGRSLYTPLFGGVFWDVQDTLLEDIDRIEVIRGPGGTLWGANAVNGIINIITKHAIETQGTLVTAGGGAAEGPLGAARFGGSLGNNRYYRAYAKSFGRPDSSSGSLPTHDALSMDQAGFRADWTSRGGDTFTAQGDRYRGAAGGTGATVDPANPFDSHVSLTRLSGQNLQFRWQSVQSSRSDTSLQAYVDDTSRSDSNMVITRRTVDVDFDQHLKLGSRNDAVWGLGYRRSNDNAVGAGFTLIRGSNISGIATAFVQDEIAVVQRLRLTLGTKIQFDSVSHLQLQPTLRLLFKLSPRQTMWAAATSAVRTPAETELYGRINVGAFPDGAGGTALVVVHGNPTLKPERVEAYEVGYRWQLSANTGFDATAFHNRIRDITGAAPQAPSIDSSGQLIFPINVENFLDNSAYGAEFLLTNAVTPNWNIALGYSFLQSVTFDDDGLRSTVVTEPKNQLQLRSNMQLSQQFALNAAAFYAGRIGDDVPAYVRLDAQLSWHPAKQWDFSITVQNLLHARHEEFARTAGGITIPRTVNGKITWRF
jgi:iron complex outermembrane receptor protein